MSPSSRNFTGIAGTEYEVAVDIDEHENIATVLTVNNGESTATFDTDRDWKEFVDAVERANRERSLIIARRRRSPAHGRAW